MPRQRRSDLTPAEQEHVRTLIRVLHVRLGTWPSVTRALPFALGWLFDILAGRREVSATVAFRVARAFDAPIDAVLTGQALPPGTYRHCGMPADE